MTDKPSSTLIGVCLQYCVDGKEVEVWLDLGAVKAVTWEPKVNKVKERPANQPASNNPPPSGSKGSCTTISEPPLGDICWYNGSAWICD